MYDYGSIFEGCYPAGGYSADSFMECKKMTEKDKEINELRRRIAELEKELERLRFLAHGGRRNEVSQS